MIQDYLRNLILAALKELGLNTEGINFNLEHPEVFSHGDYATNVALVAFKGRRKFEKAIEGSNETVWVKYGIEITNPIKLAEAIKKNIEEKKFFEISKIEVAGPGFINFYLHKSFFSDSIKQIISQGESFGLNKNNLSKNILIEYTDPNPFKQFHIGHLMSNAIGESVSRLLDVSGANITRACYSGDVGLHVAKAIWGYKKLDNYLNEKKERVIIYDNQVQVINHNDEIAFWGMAYALGSSEYDSNEDSKKEIDLLNKEIFIEISLENKRLFDSGKKISIEHFNEIYNVLGTKFDKQFFESEMVKRGLEIVEKGLQNGVFEQSEGAIVFKGEKYDSKLHTRVFVNSHGVPTYETKELALNEKKFELYPQTDLSIIVTANEQSQYFKVVLMALSQINPEIANKTKHISHGMLRFASGKMSSRKGNIVTGESLIKDVRDKVLERIKDRDLLDNEKQEIADIISVGAIKYSILKSAPGSDIIFDFDKSISFEGDSGPYLQYSCVRAQAILEKAKAEKVKLSYEKKNEEVYNLEKMLYRFPEIVERAGREYAPHYLALYLTQLASEFSTFYGQGKIVDREDVNSPYKVALTSAFLTTMQNGLNLLGIKVPKRM